MNEIRTGCCRKVYPWSVLHERRVVRIQGMQSVLSIYSPLYNLLFKQLFYYILCYWAFFTETHKNLCTALHLPAPTLPSRAEHPNYPFPITQASRDFHAFTIRSTFIQLCDHNSIDLHFYFLILIFFSIHENHLADPEHSKHLRHLLNVFCRLQLMRYSIHIWEIRDC